MLVCTASALLMILFIEFFSFSNPDAMSGVVQGILTGVGFIGAGAIMKNEDHVHGLTTAATVWAVSVLGLVIGLGYYTYSIWAVAFFFGILLLGKWERRYHHHG